MQNIIRKDNVDTRYAILVNRKNPYNAKDYEKFKYINIKSTDNREIIVENITYQHFLELKNEMEKENVIMGIKHALRDKIEQQSLYEQFCIKYGKDYADKIVCPVGTSEHHTGLALDIEVKIDNEWISNNDNFDITEPILKKIHPILYKYGFILRYPKNSEKTTKVPYEPWHIRYVGKELAQYLYENELLLEDFYNINN